jgi:hypothetical protein
MDVAILRLRVFADIGDAAASNSSGFAAGLAASGGARDAMKVVAAQLLSAHW